MPSRSARMSFFIFIASSTSSSWPRVTTAPGATSTESTTPGIGAVTALSPIPLGRGRTAAGVADALTGRGAVVGGIVGFLVGSSTR